MRVSIVLVSSLTSSLILGAWGPLRAESPKHPVSITRHADLGAAQDVEAGLAAAFDPLEVWVGKEKTKHRVRSCLDILGLAPQTIYTQDPADQRPLISMEAHCWALTNLREARPAARSFLNDFRLGEKAPRVLPAAFTLHVSRDQTRLVEVAAAAGRSWKAFDPKIRAQLDERGELRVQGDWYEAIVTEYARGDFDGDGIEDILIRRDAFPNGGTLANFAVFLLTRTSPRAPLKVLKTWENAY